MNKGKRDKRTITIKGDQLPSCHREREAMASGLGTHYAVRVNRFGTGNSSDSGVTPGCGVISIEVDVEVPDPDRVLGLGRQV